MAGVERRWLFGTEELSFELIGAAPQRLADKIAGIRFSYKQYVVCVVRMIGDLNPVLYRSDRSAAPPLSYEPLLVTLFDLPLESDCASSTVGLRHRSINTTSAAQMPKTPRMKMESSESATA